MVSSTGREFLTIGPSQFQSNLVPVDFSVHKAISCADVNASVFLLCESLLDLSKTEFRLLPGMEIDM